MPPPSAEAPPGSYRVPAAATEAEVRERGSRFLAFIQPAAGPSEARHALDLLARRFPDATHHCWAWRLGHPAAERSSDAGEPSGTAGLPILQVLRGAELSDVLAVVVRWFGGTKLGKGGLARAYAAATREALEELRVFRRIPSVTLTLTTPYTLLGAVKRLVHPPEVRVVVEQFGEDVNLTLSVHVHCRESFENALADLGLRGREVAPEEPA
jgi:uncharacterized YigZ family protein